MRNCELEKDSFSIPFMIPLIPILVPITQKCAKNGQGIGNCDSLRIGIGPPLIGGRTERTRGVMIPAVELILESDFGHFLEFSDSNSNSIPQLS